MRKGARSSDRAPSLRGGPNPGYGPDPLTVSWSERVRGPTVTDTVPVASEATTLVVITKNPVDLPSAMVIEEGIVFTAGLVFVIVTSVPPGGAGSSRVT